MFDLIQFTLREGLFMLGGAFIAWNVPRPEWSVKLQKFAVAQYNDLKAKYSK